MNTVHALLQAMARQLNDHEQSPRGAIQPTFYTWTEPHLKDALELAGQYLFSIKPSVFAKAQCHQTTELSCLVDLNGACGKVIDLLAVNGSCDNIRKKDIKTNNLTPLLKTKCNTPKGESFETYNYQFVADGIIQFEKPLPSETPITYLCAASTGVDNMTPFLIGEYSPLLMNYALWWVLLTDNDSRSNQPRWESYFIALREFVTLKMQLEFSLKDDGFDLLSQRTPQQ